MRRVISKGGSRPVSRVLSWTTIHLGCTSPCTSSDLPGNDAGHAHVPLFGLAPGGVYPATAVASGAVRSYRTISPLPEPEGHRRYIFCGTFRRLAPPRRYLAPCPVEPGLSSVRGLTAAVRPTSKLKIAAALCLGKQKTSVSLTRTRSLRPEFLESYNLLIANVQFVFRNPPSAVSQPTPVSRRLTVSLRPHRK